MSLENVWPDRWVRGDYRAVAVLARPASALALLGIRFSDDDDDGLGKILIAGVELSSKRRLRSYSIFRHRRHIGSKPRSTCCISPQILRAWRPRWMSSWLKSDARPAISPGLRRTCNSFPHAVWRQDDNGQRFEVGVYSSRSEATQHLRRLESLGHKQAYLIVQVSEGAA